MQSHVFADSNKFRAAVVYRCVLHCVCDCSPHAGSSRGAASILVEAGMVYKENLPEQHVKPPRVKANPNGKSGAKKTSRQADTKREAKEAVSEPVAGANLPNRPNNARRQQKNNRMWQMNKRSNTSWNANSWKRWRRKCLSKMKSE